jgi:hypothetical protein
MTGIPERLAAALADRYRIERIDDAGIVPLFADPVSWKAP